jgi:hypothetical protein
MKKKKRIKLRAIWIIKPQSRVKQSKKLYDRKKVKTKWLSSIDRDL